MSSAVLCRVFGFLSLLTLVSAAPAALAEGARRDTPSGLPVPRFVSLRYGETNCRAGPSFEHPVSIKFMRAGAPVMVIAETQDHWRKLRDLDGSECWAHQTTLSARSHVLVLRDTMLRARPAKSSAAKARLAAGLLAEFESMQQGWSRVTAAGVTGWTETDALWGADIAPRQ